MDTKAITKCRGTKLIGIRKYKESKLCDHNYEGLILEFSNGHIIHITADVIGSNDHAYTKIDIINEEDI